jgi:molecular chaperone DnaJ
MSDHYETLNVSRDATNEQIKKSYRELAFKWHPDRNAGNPQAEEQFKKINEAYSVLGDPEKKARYDMGAGEGFPAYETAGQGYNPYGAYGRGQGDEDGQFSWTFYGPFAFGGNWQRPEPKEPTRQEAVEWLLRSVLTLGAGILLLRVSMIFGIFGLLLCLMAIGRGFMNSIRAIKLLFRLRKRGA